MSVPTFLGKGRFFKADIVSAGLCRTQYDIQHLIARGVLPKPHKLGDTKQSRAFWLPEEVEAAFVAIRERAKRTA